MKSEEMSAIEEVFVCGDCDKTFKHKSKFSRHLKSPSHINISSIVNSSAGLAADTCSPEEPDLGDETNEMDKLSADDQFNDENDLEMMQSEVNCDS